jgi:formate dehydrogenase iron-sulfur subunit
MRNDGAVAESPAATLIDQLLEEQQRLSAVERFAKRHNGGQIPAQARYYRDLIPRSKPGEGEQYAFGVDLDACTGCKACVSACHSLNGLDEHETWRSVGLIHGGTETAPYQQTVTTACHHCADPACMNGCPVGAYEKEEDTGIVRHLDDQCIGCQYCMLKCPYDVPKYSAKRGIVRKCDMCHSRLAVGEAPACVQACPTGAITIRVVNRGEMRAARGSDARMIPGAFPSDYTLPTTRYSSRRQQPARLWSGDEHGLRLEHEHWPLIAMLLFTQLSTGLHGVLAAALMSLGAASSAGGKALSLAAFLALNLGLAVSVLHLGRPLGAWRAFLGLRTSWMSREILAFTVFAGASAACLVTTWWPQLVAIAPILTSLTLALDLAALAPVASAAALLTGLAGVFCSAMIYIDTRRTLWCAEVTHPRFFGTVLLLGTTSAACLLTWTALLHDGSLWALAQTCAIAATIIRTLLFARESIAFICALRDGDHPNHRSACTAWSFHPWLVRAAVALFGGSTILSLGAIVEGGLLGACLATAAFALTLGAKIIERYFYFATVVAPRMPGGVTA